MIVDFSPEWITAVSTMIIASAGIVFGWKQLQEGRRESEKEKSRHILSRIIKPFLNQLDLEIHRLKDRQYDWNIFSQNFDSIKQLKIEEDDKTIFKDFQRKNSVISGEIENHNKLVSSLHQNGQNLAETIWTDEFEAKSRKFLDEWNEANKGISSIPQNDAKLIVRFVIDNIQKLETSYTYYAKFWDVYGKELLPIRESPETKERLETIEKITVMLVESSEKIKRELENILWRYWAELGLPLSALEEGRIQTSSFRQW